MHIYKNLPTFVEMDMQVIGDMSDALDPDRFLDRLLDSSPMFATVAINL